MRIVSLELKNFRCFGTLALDFQRPVVLIVGSNGTGKTSILEALHYACYLRSFKTRLPKEFIKLNTTGCAITLNIAAASALDTLHATVSTSKKAIKLNQKSITSFKELYSTYKTVTIIEDDLLIVQGSPSHRRLFIDQLVALLDPQYNQLLKKYRHIVDNRNALLADKRQDKESYLLWTAQLFKYSELIQQQRKKLLERVAQQAIACASRMGLTYTIDLVYEYAKPYTMADMSCDEFLSSYGDALVHHEYAYKRSLFGAHLDDFKIIFQEKASRIYASRGQQKLLVFLLKLAHLALIKDNAQEAVLLVDDFMTDFDKTKIDSLMSLMTQLAHQVIITSALSTSLFEKYTTEYNIQVIDLNSPCNN